jgi:hypothetical protein
MAHGKAFKWYIKTPMSTCTCPHCNKLMRVGIQLRVYTDKGGCSVWKVTKTNAKREVNRNAETEGGNEL